MKDENKNGHLWQRGIVPKLIKGKDGIVGGAQLYHLELTCDRQTNTVLDPTAPEFRPLSSRPRRMPRSRLQMGCRTLQHKGEPLFYIV